MSTGPRFARRTDTNHAELRNVIKECQQAFPEMKIAWLDTSNLGGKVGDGVIQFLERPTYAHVILLNTHLLEFKSGKKKKFTASQERNPLMLTRINERADIFDLIGQNDWELA